MSILLFWQESGFEYVADGLVKALGQAVTSQTRDYSYRADGLMRATGKEGFPSVFY